MGSCTGSTGSHSDVGSRLCPRPRVRRPLRVPLVPAYVECTAPDRVHGAATRISELQSANAVIGGADRRPVVEWAPDRFIGSVRISAVAGDPTTHADEADVRLKLDVTDVRRKSDLADYGGILLVPLDIRLTDRYNGCCRVGGPQAATVAAGWVRDALDFRRAVRGDRGPGRGSPLLDHPPRVEAIAPAVVLEGARSTWELGQIQVFSSAGEPSPFAVQGVFIP